MQNYSQNFFCEVCPHYEKCTGDICFNEEWYDSMQDILSPELPEEYQDLLEGYSLDKQYLEITTTRFIILLADHFRSLGYPVPYTFEKDAHELYSDIFDYEKIYGNILSDKDLLELRPVFQSIFCKNREQDLTFGYDYDLFVENLELILDQGTEGVVSAEEARGKKFEYDSAILNKENDVYQKRYCNKHLKKINELLEKAENPKNIPEKTLNKKEKEFNEIKSSYKKAVKKANIDSRYNRFIEIIKEKTHLEFSGSLDDLSKLLDQVLKEPDLEMQMKLFNYIKWQISVVKKADKFEKENNIAELKNQKKYYEDKIEYHKNNIDSYNKIIDENKKYIPIIEKIILKEEVIKHRNEFIDGKNAVQSTYKGEMEEVPDVSYSKLKEKEKYIIKHFIKNNALSLKTRLVKNLKTKQKKSIDMKETCKAACSTGGVPIKIVHVKPKKENIKLVLFLDISGSCRKASEMLMIFAHEMQQVFPGGCKNYVFVNRLYDAGEFFNSPTPEESMKEILENVPTRGVYSDYYTPLKQYYSDHLNEIDKNTIVIFMGDARNNKNDTGEDFFKEICARSRKTYFFNTEPRERWNTKDSIIGIYNKYADRTFETTTPRQLFKSTMEIR